MSVKQSGLTFVARVRRDAVDALKHDLIKIQGNIGGHREAFSNKHPTLHYMSFVLLERNRRPEDPVDLVWEVNCDGSRRSFLRHFCETELTLLSAAFAHCEDFPGSPCSPAQLRRFLGKRDAGHSTYYIAFPGKSVAEIKQEARLFEFVRNVVDGFADKPPPSLLPPPYDLSVRAQIFLELKRKLAASPGFDFLREPPPEQAFTVRDINVGRTIKIAGLLLLSLLIYGLTSFPGHRIALCVPLAVLLLALVLGAYVLWLSVALLRTEDKEDVEEIRWDRKRIAEVTLHEDRSQQNHLTHITELRAGWLRAHLAKVVFFLIQLLAHIRYNRGELGGIATIHFARWTVLPDGWVLFFSNYDGSWTSYLGDFVDRASEGLTAVWSNTRGYPRSVLLTGAGARDEERFLSFGRNHQERSWVWFSAYPDLTVATIQSNAAIRRSLGQILGPPPNEPLSEAEREHFINLSEAELEVFLRRC